MYGWTFCFGVSILTLNLKLIDGYEDLQQHYTTSSIVDHPNKENENDQDASSFVVDGLKAKLGQFPATAAIRWPNGTFFSNGVILRQDWVLTASHPFQNRPQLRSWFVTAGDVEWKSLKKSKCLTKVTQIWINPEYLPRGDPWNLCLLRVYPEFVFNKCVKLAPLPTTPPEEGKICHVSSWGSTKAGGPEERKDMWFHGFEIKSVDENGLAELEGAKGKGSICWDDEGAGLLCNGRLTSIVSTWPDSSCKRSGFGVSVFNATEWIKKTMGRRETYIEGWQKILLAILLLIALLTLIAYMYYQRNKEKFGASLRKFFRRFRRRN